DVVAGAAVDRQADDARGKRLRGDRVVAGAAVDRQRVGGLRMVDIDLRGQADNRDAGAGRHHVDQVGLRGGVHGHLIDRQVGRSGADDAEVDLDLFHVGAGQVADRDVVGAARGSDVDGLNVVEVHGDVADVAGQRRVAVARGGEVHDLVDVGAVELQRIGAGAAVDRVVAVARIPDEGV